jgi:hypothetical protein
MREHIAMICGNNPPLRLLADEPAPVLHAAYLSTKAGYGGVAS